MEGKNPINSISVFDVEPSVQINEFRKTDFVIAVDRTLFSPVSDTARNRGIHMECRKAIRRKREFEMIALNIGESHRICWFVIHSDFDRADFATSHARERYAVDRKRVTQIRRACRQHCRRITQEFWCRRVGRRSLFADPTRTRHLFRSRLKELQLFMFERQSSVFVNL